MSQNNGICSLCVCVCLCQHWQDDDLSQLKPYTFWMCLQSQPVFKRGRGLHHDAPSAILQMLSSSYRCNCLEQILTQVCVDSCIHSWSIILPKLVDYNIGLRRGEEWIELGIQNWNCFIRKKRKSYSQGCCVLNHCWGSSENWVAIGGLTFLFFFLGRVVRDMIT